VMECWGVGVLERWSSGERSLGAENVLRPQQWLTFASIPKATIQQFDWYAG
jgi:hypothetical protein